MRSPIENVTEHPAEKDKKGGSAGGDAPVCRMKAAVRKNTQYFRKNCWYFRKKHARTAIKLTAES